MQSLLALVSSFALVGQALSVAVLPKTLCHPSPIVDSNFASVSWPTVLQRTRVAKPPCFVFFTYKAFFKRFERRSEEYSGLSRPGAVESACHMRWASKLLSVTPSLFCSREEYFRCCSALYCYRRRLEVFVATRVPLVNAKVASYIPAPSAWSYSCHAPCISTLKKTDHLARSAACLSGVLFIVPLRGTIQYVSLDSMSAGHERLLFLARLVPSSLLLVVEVQTVPSSLLSLVEVRTV
jgi:hypothetical protein